MVDGVTFVVVDSTRVETTTSPETGQLVYRDPDDGAWKPKTKAADERLKFRPYLIHVTAADVLDFWTELDGGELVVKHFRYRESIEAPKDEDGLERETI